MSQYSNVSAVPLSLAVFLASDNYEHSEDQNTISATALLKPLRQIILSSRVPTGDSVVDLIQMMPSRMGSAIHDSIEQAWKNNYKVAMKTLGYPDKVIDRIRINPKPEELDGETIPIYMEQREYKQVGKFTVSGKYDFIGDGRVEDFKSTTTYTAVKGINDEKHMLQLSIYRWLNPKIVTKDAGAIQFIFTDWSKAKAMQDPKYPQQRIEQRIHSLKSIPETDNFVKQKLNQIEQHWDTPEESLPLCSDEDLLRSDPVFKYYKNPQNTKRSTKNFDTKQDAYIRMAEDNNVGIVKEVPGQVTACKFCQAFSICSQKDQLIAQGELLL